MVFPGGRIDDGDRALAGRSAARMTPRRSPRSAKRSRKPAIAVGLAPELDPDARPPSCRTRCIDGRRFRRAPRSAWTGARPRRADPVRPLDAGVQAAAEVRHAVLPGAERRPATGSRARRPGECEAAEWASAAEVLDRIGRGEASAIFPTMRNLERLAAASQTSPQPAPMRAPIRSRRSPPGSRNIDGEPHVVIPEGLGYPVTREPLRARAISAPETQRDSARVAPAQEKGPAACREPLLIRLPRLWRRATYFRWFDRCLFISNMVHLSLPKTFAACRRQ